MKVCVRCLYPEDHPLGITFDEEGVCSGCRVHEEKDTLDWALREERLRDIIDSYRAPSGVNFDCVVPVSGAKDSHFIVDLLKVKYGLNPLLVTFNKHYNTRLGIQNLAYLRTHFDCDHLMLSPNPDVCRRVARETLHHRGSMYWHCIAGYTAFPVRIAVQFRIPLIIWGAHQGIDQVGMYSHLDEVEMSERYRFEHDLMGLDPMDLIDGPEGLSKAEMEPFLYPDAEQIADIGVRGIYLNNFIRWDAKAQHEQMIEKYGYQTSLQTRTFNTYEDVDCFHYSGLHDEIKFRKWGYSKVVDHVCREIRLKRLTREQGEQLIAAYQSKPLTDVSMFCDWAGIDEDQLWALVDQHRDPRAWVKTSGGWERSASVAVDRTALENARLGVIENCDYKLTPSRDPDLKEDGYVVTARGWVGD